MEKGLRWCSDWLMFESIGMGISAYMYIYKVLLWTIRAVEQLDSGLSVSVLPDGWTQKLVAYMPKSEKTILLLLHPLLFTFLLCSPYAEGYGWDREAGDFQAQCSLATAGDVANRKTPLPVHSRPAGPSAPIDPQPTSLHLDGFADLQHLLFPALLFLQGPVSTDPRSFCSWCVVTDWMSGRAMRFVALVLWKIHRRGWEAPR